MLDFRVGDLVGASSWNGLFKRTFKIVRVYPNVLKCLWLYGDGNALWNIRKDWVAAQWRDGELLWEKEFGSHVGFGIPDGLSVKSESFQGDHTRADRNTGNKDQLTVTLNVSLSSGVSIEDLEFQFEGGNLDGGAGKLYVHPGGHRGERIEIPCTFRLRWGDSGA